MKSAPVPLSGSRDWKAYRDGFSDWPSWMSSVNNIALTRFIPPISFRLIAGSLVGELRRRLAQVVVHDIPA